MDLARGSKIYLAGPMRSLPDGGLASFTAAKQALSNRGYHVVSPLDHDKESGIDPKTACLPQLRRAIIWDLQQAAHADAVVLLPGWQQSEGARLELALARFCQRLVLEWVPDRQQLCPLPTAQQVLVGISGFAGAGKDSLAAALAPHGFRRVAFADKVKALALELDPELKKRVDQGASLDEIKRSDPSVRIWLQEVGYAARKVLGPDVWVRAALDALDPGGWYAITDVRFENEAVAIRERGGLLVRINRPGIRPANDHPSEMELANYQDWDLVVHNTGTLADLAERAREVVDAATALHEKQFG
jgi:hypothetical protein